MEAEDESGFDGGDGFDGKLQRGGFHMDEVSNI